MMPYFSSCCGEEPVENSLTVIGGEASGLCSNPDCGKHATFEYETLGLEPIATDELDRSIQTMEAWCKVLAS